MFDTVIQALTAAMQTPAGMLGIAAFASLTIAAAAARRLPARHPATRGYPRQETSPGPGPKPEH